MNRIILAFLFSLAYSLSAHAERLVILSSSKNKIKNEVIHGGGIVENDLLFFNGFVATVSDSSAKKLRTQHSNDAFIEVDGVASIGAHAASAPSSAPAAQIVPWGISAVHAREANTLSRGAGALVCVVDTGVAFDHPDLAGQVVGGIRLIGRGRLDPSDFYDDNGHGTHVSGTIAALDNSIGVVGVAPDAKIYAVKALDSKGSGFNSTIADGILKCVQQGAQVINLSLGSSSPSSLIQDAIRQATQAGAIVVAAAGNSASDVLFPAAYAPLYNGMYAVSAVDSSLKLASFSCFGPAISFGAPGVGVTSTSLSRSGYSTWDGTSMAAPHVTGVAALAVASGRSGLSAQDIGLSADQQGAGLIDALNTVSGKSR